MGAAFSYVLPDSYDLLANSQIQGRVRPSLLDLIAALATGLAGAVALARRDVAAVLPGVAIAISLVPPLVVVGVCAGQGALVLASGALLLFMSNLVALVLAGLFVFAVLGYDAEAARSGDLSPRRTYASLTLLLAAVLVPLAANSVLTYLVSNWEATADRLAADWVDDVPDATVERVKLIGTTFEVHVRSPVPVPRPAALLRELDGRVPDGLGLRIVTTLGSVTDVGVIGE